MLFANIYAVLLCRTGVLKLWVMTQKRVMGFFQRVIGFFINNIKFKKEDFSENSVY